MSEQVVKDSILAAFNVDFYKNTALCRQAVERIVDGRAVVLVITPDSLPEMNCISVEKKYVVDPRKGLSECACPELQNESYQLADRVLKGGSKRDCVIVTMNDGIRVVLPEIALEGPIVGKAEREQRIGVAHRTERDNVSAIIGASDTHELFAGHRMKVGE